jgi:TIGR03009 family protein
MRPVGIAVAATLLAVLAARAQPPAAPPAAPGVPPAPAADPRVDAHLLGWQKTMGGVSNFHAKFELDRTDSVFKKKRSYTGSVLCMKPNLARLRIDSTTDKNDYEAYICNGKSIYEYNGLQKTITEFKLSTAPGAGADNLMLDFLSGMTADAAKKRFQIAVFNEDPNYVYLDIKPVLAKDRQEFEQVRFALFGPRVQAPFTPYLPAQVFVQKPNGDQEMWKFSGQQTNVPGVDAKAFEFVNIPGWTAKQAALGPVAPAAGGPPALPGGTGLPAGPGAVKP